ncbi:class I SAM-dependent DNA methyltransferase [Chloroflexota bacterium]
MAFEVGERTLSPEVSQLFEGFLGCKIASEGILPERKQFDFFLILDGLRIVVELKIGFEKLNSAIVQAEEYKEQLRADGIIAIAYPQQAKQTVTRPEDVRDIALGLRPTVTVLTPFLKHHYPQISLAELAKNLIDSLAKPTAAPSIDVVVQALRQSVQGISLEIRRTAGMDSPIIKQTVGSLALFKILSQEDREAGNGKEEATKGAVADLAAYILVNQILLYHILNKSLELKRRMEPIVAPVGLNSYFKVINDIDYKAVYCTDVASNISPSAVTEINIAILAIRALQPENLRHELLGRIFHEFLPFETRKRLGTFYTRPQAADILAGLAIDKPDEKVLDPACGSGTLLVSAYHRKKMIGKGRPHKKLVEEEITGVDIMPFAAHLAALNLTMQSPLEPTDRTRIGTGNSLNLTSGGEVGNVARWLQAFGGDIMGIDVDQPLTKGEVFKLQPVDVVIMNPPFTRKERLTPGMKSIQWSFLGDQNYWAYFIPLADSFLKKNGKIAAVLPRDFFRGEYSRSVRQYLFKDSAYSLKYVVKTTKDTAFSENARFRDFLIVLEKGGSQTKCAFVYLKKKISELNITEPASIPLTIRQLKVGDKFEDESVFVTWQDQSEISANYRDLGQLVTFNTRAGESLLGFYREALAKATTGVTRLSESKTHISVLRGLEPSVENLLNLIFVVRPICKDRISRSELILSHQGGKIGATLKDSSVFFEIPAKIAKKGLKTAAYVSQLDVNSVSDLAILKPFDGLQEIQNKLGIAQVDFKDIASKAKDRMSHLLLARRFNFAAPGTRALAFFCSEKALGGKAFWTFSTDPTESKVLCLWLNSTLAFIESLLLQSETEGSFIEITKEKLLEFHIPDLTTCDTSNLLAAFEQIRHVEFPPLIEQFESPPEPRVIIDRAVFKTIGYSDNDTEDILPELYKAMATELRSWKELMHHSSAKEKEPTPQLHLFARE